MENKPMTVSTPEREGIPSKAIENYMRAIDDQKLAMHSIMVVRHGKIVFESYYKPFDKDFRHRLYSCSKSFVSVAIGYCASKGLLSLDDRIIKYFDDFTAGITVDEYLEECTIRDLLLMASPYTKGSNYDPTRPDWRETFFDDEVSHPSGSVFSYCTSGTTILCYIIRKVTGKDFLEVLRPVFDEIGIGDEIFCVKSPDGVEWGGSGVCATPREFAKFANLVMHYGLHEGKQILPRDYLMEATSRQIDNSTYGSGVDDSQGYGYQFWMLRHGGFAFFGMGGQYALCLPKEDLMIITTGYDELYSNGRRELFYALWREIFPYLSDTPLADDEKAFESLKNYAENMRFVHCEGPVDSPVREKINGKTFVMRKNGMGMKYVRLAFNGDECDFEYENATGIHMLKVGVGKNIYGEFPEKYYAACIGERAEKGYNSYTSGAWTTENTFMIHCYVADIYHGQLRLAVAFKDDKITLLGIKHAEWFMNEFEGFAAGRMSTFDVSPLDR